MGAPSLSLAGTDKKLENAAAAAQQPNWDPRWGLEKLKAAPAPYTCHGKREGCAKLGNLQETFKKIATKRKKRKEMRRMILPGRAGTPSSSQHFGKALLERGWGCGGSTRWHTGCPGTWPPAERGQSRGLGMCPAACKECCSSAGGDNPADE